MDFLISPSVAQAAEPFQRILSVVCFAPQEEVIKEEKTALAEAAKDEHSDIFVPVDLNSSQLSDVTAQEDVFSAANSKKLELHASLFEDEVSSTEAKDESDLFIPKDAQVDTQRKVLLDDNENSDDLLK